MIVMLLLWGCASTIEVKEVPRNAKDYFNRGLAYYAYHTKEQLEKAIQDYDKAIAITSNYAEAYNNRGLAYALSNNKVKALSDFQKACDMGLELGCTNLNKVLKNL